MRNAAFLVWMIIWPIAQAMSGWIEHAEYGFVVRQYSENAEAFASLVDLVVYFGVAALLYERKGAA